MTRWFEPNLESGQWTRFKARALNSFPPFSLFSSLCGARLGRRRQGSEYRRCKHPHIAEEEEGRRWEKGRRDKICARHAWQRVSSLDDADATHTHTQRDNGLYLHTYPPATLNTENELFSFSPCLSECFVLLSVCGTNKIKTKYISFLFPFKTEYGWLPESAASASLGAIKDH